MNPTKPIRAGRGHQGVAALAVLIFSAGCGAGRSLAPTPASTPGPTATASATPIASPTATNPRGQMTHGRSTHTATALADGRVLVAVGYFNRYPITLALMAAVALLTMAGCGASASLAPAPTSTLRPTAGATPAASPTVTSPSGMTVGRQVHTATLLADGRVLVAGGYDAADVAFASSFLYHPTSGAFGPTGPLAVARGYHTATRLLDGHVLIAGGNPHQWQFNGPYLASAELYDPETGKFTATGPMTVGRGSHAATRLFDGRVLITGGSTGLRWLSLASAELYDPKTGKFTATGPMTTARTYHTANLLADYRVLVTGGGLDWNYTRPFRASAEIYDPKTGKFTATGPMAAARAYHTATLLGDGRVLATAGQGDVVPLASAEIYDPKTGTFSPAGSGG